MFVESAPLTPGDLVHTWAQSTGPVPPMTSCAVLGPVLPLGCSGRPAGTRTITCPDCLHLDACTADECARCELLAGARTTAALSVITVRLRYQPGPGEATVLRSLPVGADPNREPPARAPGPEPAEPSNPEQVQVDLPGRGLVGGYRFHLVDGFAARAAAKPVRKALHELRTFLGGTFTVAAGGAGTRSVTVFPDGGDPGADRWAVIVDTVREELGYALTACRPATGRHVEVIPF
jgi:hypothetical protein